MNQMRLQSQMGDSTQSCTIVLSATVFEIDLDWESSVGVLLTKNINFTCAPIKNKHLLYILEENLKNLNPKSKWVSFLHFLKFFLGLNRSISQVQKVIQKIDFFLSHL